MKNWDRDRSDLSNIIKAGGSKVWFSSSYLLPLGALAVHVGCHLESHSCMATSWYPFIRSESRSGILGKACFIKLLDDVNVLPWFVGLCVILPGLKADTAPNSPLTLTQRNSSIFEVILNLTSRQSFADFQNTVAPAASTGSESIILKNWMFSIQ